MLLQSSHLSTHFLIKSFFEIGANQAMNLNQQLALDNQQVGTNQSSGAGTLASKAALLNG